MSKKYEKTIFCYGSNLAGIHGAGAAKFAKDNHNAKWGVGHGWTSETSYAIPTKNTRIETMWPKDIKPYVDQFILDARNHPNFKFMVTAIGTGLAGIPIELMAGMFVNTPSNVYLPKLFLDSLYGEGNWDKEKMSYDW